MANEKVKRLKELHQQEAAIYEEKNRRYGDSFSATMKEYGPKALCLRLDDKLSRLKSLLLGGQDAGDESVTDTLMDLANYANMGIIELTQAAEASADKPNKAKGKKPKKDRAASKETPKTPAKEQDTEKGPLDDLSKKQLMSIIKELGGEVQKKMNREKLLTLIAGYPKAKVAVAITSIKASTPAADDSDGDNDGDEE